MRPPTPPPSLPATTSPLCVERTGKPEDRLGGSHRFRIIATLAGWEFETFLLDVGLRHDPIAEIDTLTTSDLPSLAGIDRATHDPPAQLPFPPADWLVPLRGLAEAVGVAPDSPAATRRSGAPGPPPRRGSVGRSGASGRSATIAAMAGRRGAGDDDRWSLFAAESEYAQSLLCSLLGDAEGCLAALRSALDALPTYAPAILSLGSVEYQLERPAEGRRLFLSLLELPDNTEDLADIIDEAGDFLISIGAYADGIDLYRAAAARFPEIGALHQGMSCCADHEGLHVEAIAAAEAAIALEPDNQEFVNDLGWSLYLAGRLQEARATLARAAAMDPADQLAAENLRVCESTLKARAA